jgi:hypothetical protein
MMVLRWFCHAGLPLNDEDGPPIPEPPMEPVRRAMLWYDRRALARRLKDLAPVASEDGDLDRLYTAIHKVVGRARVPDPQLSDRIRAIVLAGEDLPGGRDRVRRTRDAIVQSLAAQTAGAEEIGSDLLVDSLTAIGMLPTENAAAVKASMRTHELAGIPVLPGIDPADGQRRIEAATANQLQEARDTARTLLALAGFTQLLRWGAPDTVPLDAVEEAFVRHGLGMLLHTGLGFTEPNNLIPATSVILEPLFAGLARNLLDDLPPHPFGDMQAQLDGMMRNLKAATSRVG